MTTRREDQYIKECPTCQKPSMFTPCFEPQHIGCRVWHGCQHHSFDAKISPLADERASPSEAGSPLQTVKVSTPESARAINGAGSLPVAADDGQIVTSEEKK